MKRSYIEDLKKVEEKIKAEIITLNTDLEAIQKLIAGFEPEQTTTTETKTKTKETKTSEKPKAGRPRVNKSEKNNMTKVDYFNYLKGVWADDNAVPLRAADVRRKVSEAMGRSVGVILNNYLAKAVSEGLIEKTPEKEYIWIKEETKAVESDETADKE